MILKEFQIKTKQSKHYFNVLIFSTRKEMWLHTDELKSKNTIYRKISHSGFEARCLIYSHNSDLALGEIHFHLAETNSSIVAHELAHATFCYQEKINGNKLRRYNSANSEEGFCRTLTNLQHHSTKN